MMSMGSMNLGDSPLNNSGVIRVGNLRAGRVDNSGGEMYVREILTANLVENKTGCIYADRKLVLDVREFNGLENIRMEGTEEVELVGLQTPVNLALFDSAPSLRHLTLREVSGLALSDANFKALQALRRRGVVVTVTGNEEFEQGYRQFAGETAGVISSTNTLADPVRVEQLQQQMAAAPDCNATHSTSTGDSAEPITTPFQPFSVHSSEPGRG